MLHSIVQSLKVVLIALLAVLVLLSGQRLFTYAVNRETPADTGQTVSFEVKKDDDASSVGARLADAHLIRSPLVFKAEMRLGNDDLVPGTYNLRRGMSVSDIIGIISGKTTAAAPAAAPATIKLTVIEGWRNEQIAEAAAGAGLQGGVQAFNNALAQVNTSQYAFLADKPKNASLLGYLFPDTYDFHADAPGDLITYMLQNFDQKFTPQMRQQAKQEGLTIYQVLTLASIVEREAQDPRERPIIASVYLNRLKQGMMLQADPTVQFAVGVSGNWWPAHLTEAQLQVDSPYNTYKNGGLPPGPICNPGLASILAVLNPANTDYLYFVAKGDGTHAFASTLDEQNANIAKYQGGAGAAATATIGSGAASGTSPAIQSSGAGNGGSGTAPPSGTAAGGG